MRGRCEPMLAGVLHILGSAWFGWSLQYLERVQGVHLGDVFGDIVRGLLTLCHSGRIDEPSGWQARLCACARRWVGGLSGQLQCKPHLQSVCQTKLSFSVYVLRDFTH